MFIINNIEDQILLLTLAKIPSNLLVNQPYNDLSKYFSYTEQLMKFFIYTFHFLFGINYLNVLILVAIFMNLLFSYFLFKRFKYGYLYAILFSFSSYFWLHLGTHISLSQLWLYPLLFILLNKKYKNLYFELIYFSLYLLFSIFISNYIGFILLIYFCHFLLFDLIVSFFKTHKINFNKIFFLLITIFIVGSGSLLVFKAYKNSMNYLELNSLDTRPLEDFFTFSSRPWYFLISSPKSLIYSQFSTQALDNIKSTGYFLADDYFNGEHPASFFGYVLLLTFFVVSGYILYKGSNEQKLNLYKYWFINICLFLFMMPPFFTLAGITIYTPGWLIYKFFPMFRTTVRMSVLILLNILLVLAPFFDDLSRKYPKKHLLIFTFVTFLTGLTLLETFIPVKIQFLDTPPQVYSYIGENHAGTNFVVYPYPKNQEALFWVDVHKSYLLNIRMYKKGDFDSEIFTKALNTDKGLLDLKNRKVDYLIAFKDISNEDLNFFQNNKTQTLNLEKEFDDSYLFKVLK